MSSHTTGVAVAVRAMTGASIRFLSFVHHNVGDFEHAQIGLEQVCVQAFRAQVQELVVSVGGVVQGQVHFPAVHAGMDGHGPYAPLPEVLHLVFHEGD